MGKRYSACLRAVAVIIWMTCLATTPSAQQGATIPFQGQLTNQAGEPLSPSTPLSLTFRLYKTPVGGAVLWEEVQPNIMVISGRFNVLLGSRVRFPNLEMFKGSVYLGITIDDGKETTADVELRPRQAIVPAVSAVIAFDSDKLAGRDWSAILKDGSNDPNTGLIRASKVDPLLLTPLETKVAELEKALAQVKQEYPPIGTIISYAGAITTLPAGWMLCDGRELSRTDFPKLFEKIGTAWGSSSADRFNLPDLRGRFLRGVAGDSQRDPESSARTASRPGGNTGNAVGSVQEDALQQHRHDNEAHTHTYNDRWQGDERSDDADDRTVAHFQEVSEDRTTKPTQIRITGVLDGRVSPETRVKNAYVYWLIKVN